MLNNYYWIWSQAIPKEICDFVLSTCNWKEAQDGTVYQKDNGFEINKNLRITDVIWANKMSVIGCISATYIRAANQSAGWNFDLTDMENTQLGRYSGGGHYSWHADTFAPENGQQRKLSISILLNDFSEFEGGEFKFKNLSDEQQPKLTQGSVLVFPSFLEHMVTPITSGVRYSAVTWCRGASFK